MLIKYYFLRNFQILMRPVWYKEQILHEMVISKGEMNDLKGYESCSITTPKFVELNQGYNIIVV